MKGLIDRLRYLQQSLSILNGVDNESEVAPITMETV